MEINIYSQDGTLKLTASPGSGGQCVKQLQGDSELSLSFDYFSYVALDVNDYVDFCGDRYWLLEQYRPKEVSTIQWRYDVKLYGIESLIKRYLVIEHTDGDANPVFTLTAPASQHMRMIVECLNNATGTTDWQLGTVLTTGNITIDYTGKYCDEGLRELAEAANTEYWFSGDNGKTLNLCRCERGETIELKYGAGLISLERDVADNAKFYTRLYPVGSSRNINPETYGHTRLQLPNNQKYVDLDIAKYGVIDHYERDAFSGIYPRYTGTVSTVRVEDRTDEDGTEFKVYFIKDASLPFNPNNFLLPNEKIRISFQTGDLQGLGETDDHYFEADYNSTTGEFEIINIWTDGEQLPRPGLEPETGNSYIPWNISMPQTYITMAEQELAAAVSSYNQAHFVDNSVYRGTTNHVWIEADQTRNIYIGRLVKLVSSQYFPGTGYRNSRIVKITRRLDLPSQMELEISDAVSTGTLTKINDGIRGVWDFVKGLETDDNGKWLSKRHNDTAQGLIRLIRGLQVGERFVTGLLGEGGIFRKEADGTTYIEADKLYIRMKAYFDSVEIHDYRHSAGNRIASEAGANCCRVDWIDASGNSLKQTSENLASTVMFRCYFRGSDGEDEVRNNFIVGDLAYCHITTVETEDDSPIAKGLNKTHYWRLIVGRNPHGTLTDDGEHWIDLSNRVSETVTISGTSYTRKGYQPGSDVPAAQNDIIQLGNIRDTDRQGAIIEFVTGADAPSYQIFQGIGSDVSNPYSLEGKNYVRLGYDSESGGAQAYIGNPDGSTYLWYHNVTEGGVTFPRLDIKANVRFTSPTTHQETTIEDFADAMTKDIEYIQNQIDGELDTWYYDGVPTLSNAPANQWTTDDEKKKHVGDLYYDKGTGFVYRFLYDNDNEQYYWTQIHDDAISEALRIASDAQDTADNKRRVFVGQPKPISPNTYVEYDVGDLWVNATYPSDYSGDTDVKNGKYKNDLLSCKVAKPKRNEQGAVTDGTFSIDDWELATKYGTALQEFLTNTYPEDLKGIESQLDGKAETWYQDDDPQEDWDTDDKKKVHLGDIWYDTSEDGGKKTYIYRERKEGKPRYYWQEASVPDDVFDAIDGKAAIYVAWGAWVVDEKNELNPKDLFIPSANVNPSGSDTTYYKDKVYRCLTVGDSTHLPTFEEISYSDDSAFNAYINAILNGSGSSGDAATVAAAQRAIQGAMGGGTVVDGGLLLTSLIAMRKYNGGDKDKVSSYTTWAGISGQYDSTLRGGGIAAWFGGSMVDGEFSPSAGNAAKSMFRFDGSGYVASKNISWDDTGKLYIRGYEITINDSNVATESMLSHYVTTDTDQEITGKKTFGTGDGSYIQIGAIRIVYDQSSNALKIVGSDGSSAANFYATGGVSALGAGSGGSSGGVDMDTVWNALANSGSQQINATHLSTALSAYNPTNNFKTINGNSIIGTGNITIESSGGNFLPLTGGTMTGGITMATTSSAFNAKGILFGTDGSAGRIGGNSTALGVYSAGTLYLRPDSETSVSSYGVVISSSTITYNGNTIWHSGNDGSGSGLNADLLDGLHSSAFAKLYTKEVNHGEGVRIYCGSTYGAMIFGRSSNGTTSRIILMGTGYSSTAGAARNHWRCIDKGGYVAWTNASTTARSVEIMNTNTEGVLNIYVISPNGTVTFTDITELSGTAVTNVVAMTESNVASATKLNEEHTIWGQSFDGTDDVSGAISGATTINATDNITINRNATTATYVEVKNTRSSVRLHVGGGTALNRGVYDSHTSAWLIYTSSAGNTFLPIGNVGIGTTSPTEKLEISGNAKATKFIGALEGNADTATTASKLSTVSKKAWGKTYWTSGGIPTTISGDMTSVGNITFTNNARIHQPDESSTALYIGNESNSGWVKIADMCSQSGEAKWNILANGQSNFVKVGIGLGSTNPSYTLHVSGNIYATGAVTCLSDIREKTIVRQTGITVEQIAAMRSIVYRWKDNGDDHDEHVGSIAQDWQKALPQVVLTANDGKKTLSMQYGVAALVSAITVARKVVDHERRIRELEDENRKLREQLKTA